MTGIALKFATDCPKSLTNPPLPMYKTHSAGVATVTWNLKIKLGIKKLHRVKASLYAKPHSCRTTEELTQCFNVYGT